MRNTSLISVASPAVRKYKFPAHISVHGRLAAFLALEFENAEAWHREWQKAWPSMEEFEGIVPLNWGEAVRKCLPEAAKGMRILLPRF